MCQGWVLGKQQRYPVRWGLCLLRAWRLRVSPECLSPASTSCLSLLGSGCAFVSVGAAPFQPSGITLQTCSWGQGTRCPLAPSPGHQLCLTTFNPLTDATLKPFDGNRGCKAQCKSVYWASRNSRLPQTTPNSHHCAQGLQGGCMLLPCKGKETLSPA